MKNNRFVKLKTCQCFRAKGRDGSPECGHVAVSNSAHAARRPPARPVLRLIHFLSGGAMASLPADDMAGIPPRAFGAFGEHALPIMTLVFTLLFSLRTLAQSVPNLINYQGRAVMTSGASITGTPPMEINIYDAATNGFKVWGPQTITQVPLIDGYFNIILGPVDTNGTPLNVAFESPEAWIEVVVPGVSTDRQRILSSPYAVRAQTSEKSDNGSPVGEITAFGGPTNNIPNGWLLCDGSPASSNEYPNLYAAIGTHWGDASDTNAMYHFRLPDLRGYFLRGVAHGLIKDPDRLSRISKYIGGAQGDSVGSYQQDEYKSHKHGLYYTGSGSSGAYSTYQPSRS